jgi:hypothetical protein
MGLIEYTVSLEHLLRMCHVSQVCFTSPTNPRVPARVSRVSIITGVDTCSSQIDIFMVALHTEYPHAAVHALSMAWAAKRGM